MWPLAKKVLELLSVYKPFVSCLNGFVTCFWNISSFKWLAYLFVGNINLFEWLAHPHFLETSSSSNNLVTCSLETSVHLNSLITCLLLTSAVGMAWSSLQVKSNVNHSNFSVFKICSIAKVCHFLMFIKTLLRLLDKESKLEKPVSKQCVSKETHQAVNVHCTCVIITEPP